MDLPGWKLLIISSLLAVQSKEKPVRDKEDDDPVVSWQEDGGGKVEVWGSWMETNKNTSFASFQGIPYASPPILSNRFLRTKPIQYNSSLTKIDARGIFKTICPQPAKRPGMSEDCLYLNIYTVGRTDVLKPVMVWIHGGGFVWDSGTYDDFGPQHFLDQDVILVSFNYRLGALGYLSLGNKVMPGNMGYWDQHTALTWVHNHIEYFGGDPDQVTLFGQSAGSWSVMYHFLSRQSRGLFSKIIAQSGSPLSTDWGYIPSEVAIKNGELFAEKVGCNVSDLNCFQNLPVDLLVNMKNYLDDPTDFLDGSGNPWNGVVDSEFTDEPFLSDTPINLLKMGDFDKDVEVILGAVQEEALQFTINFYFHPELYSLLSANWTDYYGPLSLLGRTGMGDIIEKDKELSNDILEYYTGSEDTMTEDDFSAVTAMRSDAVFWAGIDRMVRLLVEHGVEVYQYIFSYRGEHSGLDLVEGVEPGMFGVSHGDDLLYLFDPLYQIDLQELNESDENMRELLAGYWTSFAKYGDPTPPGSAVSWAPVTPDSWLYLNISGTEPGMERSQDYQDRMNFWSTVVEDSFP